MRLNFDMHTHILPGVDDGAKNIEESLVLIDRLVKAGITDICLTPHYYTHKESMTDFTARRDAAFRELASHVGDKVRLHLGAEVFVTQYLFTSEYDLTKVCYNGTRYMLTEFPYSSNFSGETMSLINTLMNNHRIIPVLTHVERYPYLLKHPQVLEELIYMGIIIQSNACSFSEFSLRRKLLKLLNNGYIQVIGSDAHSLNRNTPDAFNSLYGLLEKKNMTDIIPDINSVSKGILLGK